MHATHRRCRRLTWLAALCASAAACGGGSDDAASSAASTPMPAAAVATASAAALPTPSSGLAACGDMAALLARINEFRSRPRACSSGTQPAAAALSWNAALAAAASTHAHDMARNNTLSHIGSDGGTVGQRVSAAGYDWSAVAENIAGGYATEAEAVNAWTASSAGHCEAMMNPGFTQIGGGCAYRPGTRYGHYWTIDLARPG